MTIYKPFYKIKKIKEIEPPHPKRGWGFLNFFHLIMVNLSIISGYLR